MCAADSSSRFNHLVKLNLNFCALSGAERADIIESGFFPSYSNTLQYDVLNM